MGGKLIEVTVAGHPFTIGVGMLSFPVTFLLTDLLNEFYGKKAARFVTWVGLGMALFSFAIVVVAIRLPIAEFTKATDFTGVNQPAYENVFGTGQRILLASMVAYVVAQFIDIGVFHALKRMSHNRYLWLRATGSTLVSQLIDTAVIQTLAFWGTLPPEKIANVALSSYAVKWVVAVALTPLIYAGHGLVENWLHIHPVVLDENGNPIEAELLPGYAPGE